MRQTATSSIRCPRCGHPNSAPARFCADCGLNLAGGVPSGQPSKRHGNRSGTWLVLGLLVVGIAGALYALVYRVVPDRKFRMQLWYREPPPGIVHHESYYEYETPVPEHERFD